MSTRAQLKIEKDNTFLSGGSSTRAVTVRSYEDDLIDSCVNKTDDLNANDGYLGIDSNGRVDVTKINDPTPVNKFLRDDGTWAVVNIRTTSVATATTATPNVLTTDQYNITALASAITFAAPAGVALDGQVLILRIKDNGTARAITFNPIYKFNLGISAPTTTVINTTLVVFLKWNDNLGVWQCFYTTQAAGGSVPTLTATQVAFGDGSNLLTSSADLTWNDSSKRFMVGAGTPLNELDVVGTIRSRANSMIWFELSTGTTNNWEIYGNGSGLRFYNYGGTHEIIFQDRQIGIGGTPTEALDIIFGAFRYLNQYSASATPSIAAGPGAGTSPTVSITGTNDAGVISLTAGTTPSANAVIATITFSGSWAFPNGCAVNLSPHNDVSFNVITAGTTTTFVISSSADSSKKLTASTLYEINYIVKGY